MNQRAILDKKTNPFSFLYENFQIPCHLLISRLYGDGFIANETRIQTTGTTSVSICRPAYFRRTCGKSVLGTNVLGMYRNVLQILVGLLYSRCEICVFFLSSSFLLLLIFFILK